MQLDLFVDLLTDFVCLYIYVATDTTQYLGVDLSHDLPWSHHIDRTTKKANGMLGFLKRNLRITNQETKSDIDNFVEHG
jgi:hypothetical protein